MSFSTTRAELELKPDPILVSEMSLDEAASNVRRRKGDRVLGGKTRKIDGNKTHVIKTLSPDGRIKYIRVDPRSGRERNKNRR